MNIKLTCNTSASTQRTYDANETWVKTRVGDMHMVAVIGGWLLFKNITNVERGARRKEQLPLHMSEWKFWFFRRKMTAGVTKGLLRITPNWSNNFFIDSATNEWYCSVCTWGTRGNAKNLLETFYVWKTKMGPHQCYHTYGTYDWTKVMHETHEQNIQI